MNRPTILCVDDDPMVLASLSAQLRGAFGGACSLETAESAEEALEAIHELSGSGLRLIVIVSDWLMPGLRGDELLRQVHAEHPDIMKVLLTGQADRASVEQAKRDGAVDVSLCKPWDEAALLAVIREGLGW